MTPTPDTLTHMTSLLQSWAVQATVAANEHTYQYSRVSADGALALAENAHKYATACREIAAALTAERARADRAEQERDEARKARHFAHAELNMTLRAQRQRDGIASVGDVLFVLSESAGPREAPTREMAQAIWNMMDGSSRLELAVRCWEISNAVATLRAQLTACETRP